MIPTQAVANQLGALLAADTTTLAPVAANKIACVKAAFTPSQALLIGGVTLADFDGSTPIAGATGAQLVALDPTTNDQLIDIKEPAGGYRFQTTGVTNLPQTIYGFVLVDNTGATLLGSQLLPAPITLTAAGQVIDIPQPQFRIPNGAVQ